MSKTDELFKKLKMGKCSLRHHAYLRKKKQSEKQIFLLIVEEFEDVTANYNRDFINGGN